MLQLQRFVPSHPDVKPSRHAAKGGQDEVLLNPDQQVPVAGYTDFRFMIPGEESVDLFGGCSVGFIEDLPDEQAHDFLFTLKPNGEISASIIGSDPDNPLIIDDLDQDQTTWFINIVQEWMKLNPPLAPNVIPIRPPEPELP